MDKVSNEEVLGRVGIKQEMMSKVRQRKENWIGHKEDEKGIRKEKKYKGRRRINM